MFSLLNPIDVPAKWNLTHKPVDMNTKRNNTAIRVSGFNERGPEIDDPSVFEITPNDGVLYGPTLSASSAASACGKNSTKRYKYHNYLFNSFFIFFLMLFS